MHYKSTSDTRIFRGVLRTSSISLGGNILLLAAKLSTSILTGSASLLADAIHSASDLASDLVVLLGVWLGGKPADEEHPYGHGKLETLATLSIALMIIAAGSSIIAQATNRLMAGPTDSPGIVVLVVAGISVVIKELLYRYSSLMAQRFESSSLDANAWHHRSDALSSLAVCAGAILGLFGWSAADQVMAIVVGALLIFVGGRFIYSTSDELLEARADQHSRAIIDAILADFGDIRLAYGIRTRQAGRTIHIDMRILVDSRLGLLEAHSISEKLEKALRDAISRPVSVIIHVEPDIPELRHRARS